MSSNTDYAATIPLQYTVTRGLLIFAINGEGRTWMATGTAASALSADVPPRWLPSFAPRRRGLAQRTRDATRSTAILSVGRRRRRVSNEYIPREYITCATPRPRPRAWLTCQRRFRRCDCFGLRPRRSCIYAGWALCRTAGWAHIATIVATKAYSQMIEFKLSCCAVIRTVTVRNRVSKAGRAPTATRFVHDIASKDKCSSADHWDGVPPIQARLSGAPLKLDSGRRQPLLSTQTPFI